MVPFNALNFFLKGTYENRENCSQFSESWGPTAICTGLYFFFFFSIEHFSKLKDKNHKNERFAIFSVGLYGSVWISKPWYSFIFATIMVKKLNFLFLIHLSLSNFFFIISRKAWLIVYYDIKELLCLLYSYIKI